MTVWIILCEYTTWTLPKRMEKKLDGNYTRMLRSILNKSWKQHLTKKAVWAQASNLNKHPSRMNKAFGTQLKCHKWRLPWIPTHGHVRVGLPARTYSYQPCADTGCSLEDLPGTMDDRDRERKRVSGKSMLLVQPDHDVSKKKWVNKRSRRSNKNLRSVKRHCNTFRWKCVGSW